MPSLHISESGLSLGKLSSKPNVAVPKVYGLTLSDDVIEQMIRCVQGGKEIQLSLGQHPSIQYGSKTQSLYSSPDPFHQELFQTTPSTNTSSSQTPNPKKGIAKEESKPNAAFIGMFASKKFGMKKSTPAGPRATATHTTSTSTTAGADAALEILKKSFATESQKKADNTLNFVKDGVGLPTPGKRGKSKLLSHSRLGGSQGRSMPSSPALSGVDSPSLGPTSVPISQQIADKAKANRKPVVHLLAVEDMTEEDLQQLITDVPSNDIKSALEKVAERKGNKWRLQPKYYKELDVWTFDYGTEDDRQRAIDNAVRIYDKLRLSRPDSEWSRLLPKHERGTGRHLSKVQAAIATAEAGTIRTPKVHVEKAEDSGRDTPAGKDGEANRASPQPTTGRPKKMTEKEAQLKRLLSTKPLKAAIKSAPPKKEKTKVEKAKVEKPKAERLKGGREAPKLSAEFVNSDSDDDDDSHDAAPVKKAPAGKPAPKQALKRSREEDTEASDSSTPMMKKVKKDISASKPADPTSSQRLPSTQSSQSSFTKTKGTSPHKSSPLASSTPTNASDVESSHRTSSASLSPRKIIRSPLHDRHQKSSSVASSITSTSSNRSLHPNVVDKARKYRIYYPKYEALHREVASLGRRDMEMESKLMDMHERLSIMKREIMEGIVEN
ncbi:hypothetical protein BJ878DRAFT_520921 [Calycina marina]|uniref:Uncharacterized protein n=1 Tax=Calycina marina TaxID=1763456 RepID=A0A9P7YXA7_9HELO|nr:hypothetical protein BJ878DRAFT_520921 [Calycina marina]